MEEHKHFFPKHTDQSKSIQQHLIDETEKMIDEIKLEGVILDGLLWVTYVMVEPKPYMIVILYTDDDVVSDLCHDWDGLRPTGKDEETEQLREIAIHIKGAGLKFFGKTNPHDDHAIKEKILNDLIEEDGFRLMQLSGSKKEIRRYFPLMVSSHVALADINEAKKGEDMEVSSQPSETSTATHTSTMSKHIKNVTEKALQADKQSSKDDLDLDYTMKELTQKSTDWYPPDATSSSNLTLSQVAESVGKAFSKSREVAAAAYPFRAMPDQGVGGFEVLNEDTVNLWLSKQFDTGTADTESESSDPEAYEKNKNINVCFHTGLFLLKKDIPFMETPKIIIIPSHTIFGGYKTTTHFFEGSILKYSAENLRASIHDLAELVFRNHIHQLHAVMLKFMADRFCIQNHLFKLFGIINNTVQYLPITHDGRAFLNNILIQLFNFLKKNFEKIRIPGAFARTTKRTSDKDSGYTVLIAVPDFKVLTEDERNQRLRVAEAIAIRDAERKRKKEEEAEIRRVKENKEKDKQMKRLEEYKRLVDNENTRIENQIRLNSEPNSRLRRIQISPGITDIEKLLSTKALRYNEEIILRDYIKDVINDIRIKIYEYRNTTDVRKKEDGGRKIQTRYIKTRKNTTIAKLYNKHSKKTKKYRK